MEYIGAQPENGCLFCRALAAPPEEDRANLVLSRPPGALVMLNKFPYNPGHLMVAPAAHVPNLTRLEPTAAAELMDALQLSLRVLEEALRPDGFNVGANIGNVAGAGIPDHVHLHVVPRWGGDTNFMPVLADTKVVNEHVARTWEKLRAAFSEAGA
jgi:ATP adenylyltransferase